MPNLTGALADFGVLPPSGIKENEKASVILVCANPMQALYNRQAFSHLD